MKKLGLLFLAVPGALLHMGVLTLYPELWPLNDRFVDWWHANWKGKT